MLFNHAFFDLDGTLTDPKEGILNAFHYTISKLGLENKTDGFLETLIGPPLFNSFKEHFGFNDDNVIDAINCFREFYSQKGIFQNKIYPGIEDLLAKLTLNNISLYIATSKPYDYASQIIEHFGLNKYFKDIAGSLMDGSRVEKHEIIAYQIQKHNLQNHKDIIMIGDRKHDILGSHYHSIPCISVLWGYGSNLEFQENHSDYIVDNPAQILKIICD